LGFDSDNPQAHGEMDRLQLAMESHGEASARLQTAVAIHPEARYYDVLGDAYQGIGDTAAAAAYRSSALPIALGRQNLTERLQRLPEEGGGLCHAEIRQPDTPT